MILGFLNKIFHIIDFIAKLAYFTDYGKSKNRTV